MQLPYPQTRRGDVVEVLHGVSVADPYRWLEEPESADTRTWIDQQNQVTERFLRQIASRQRIRDRLSRLWNYERFGIPHKEADRYFFTHNSGLQNQAVLNRIDSLDGAPALVLDPNGLSQDGTIALTSWSPRRDAKYVAYSLSVGGSDWREWHVRDVVGACDLPDKVLWSKFSGASWTRDGDGFFYSRYDEPKGGEKLIAANYFQKLFFHRLGSAQSDDALVYERKDQKRWGFASQVTDDGRYLVIGVSRGTDVKNGIVVKDLETPDRPPLELLLDFDATYNYIANFESRFLFFTTWRAPRGRVILIDVSRPSRDNWREVISQSAETLDAVTLVGSRLIGRYLKDAYSQVRVFEADGRPVGDVKLPGIGAAAGFDGKPGDPETFFSFTSFTTPTTIYRLDAASGNATVFREPQVDFDRTAFVTKQVFYPSKDGTRVPMFLTHKKEIEPTGELPTCLTGYGGFNIPMLPAFSASNIVWLEMGGVLALPNLRGGGEYGDPWHEAGMKSRKQTVFDDFLAAAQWLITNRYTSAKKLAIEGRSNGGLLVGACMTQRPELFAAALPAVGVLDMLRYHKFTIGWAWVPEYGSADNAEEFHSLLGYSPLHNLRQGVSYPATLITTGDHDDRVVPAHSFKFAAGLQWAQSGHAPVLIRIETRAGHGAGKPTAMLIAEAADRWAFLVHVLGMTPTF